MDKRILDLVGDINQWKGDAYKLAALVSELQKAIDREKLVSADFEIASEVL